MLLIKIQRRLLITRMFFFQKEKKNIEKLRNFKMEFLKPKGVEIDQEISSGL